MVQLTTTGDTVSTVVDADYDNGSRHGRADLFKWWYSHSHTPLRKSLMIHGLVILFVDNRDEKWRQNKIIESVGWENSACATTVLAIHAGDQRKVRVNYTGLPLVTVVASL